MYNLLTLKLGNFIKEVHFNVVPDDFTLRTDGLIGRNLLTDLKEVIDYGHRNLKIWLNELPLTYLNIKAHPKTGQVV